MKSYKKIICIVMAALMICATFAGCSSSSNEAQEITDETLIIAYTGDNSPFISTIEEDGSVTGFDVKIIETIFDDIKGDYSNYAFVKVDEDYVIGDDVAYVDTDGNEYVADIMVGGVTTNTDTLNGDYSITQSIIENKVLAVSNGEVESYSDFDGKKVGVVAGDAKDALDSHSSLTANAKSVKDYDDAQSAVTALQAGKVDVIVIDEFNLNTVDYSSLKILDNAIETINYVYAITKWNDLRDSINSAIYELQSPDYNDADEFTPIVEEYFGYDASNFTYDPT